MRARAVFRFASGLTGHVFRLIPRRWRFEFARRVAIALAPLHRRTRLYAVRPSPIDGCREDLFRMLIRAMRRSGVRYDPALAVVNGDDVPRGPAVFLSGHFLNNIVIGRWLYDRGERLSMLAADTHEQRHYAGAGVPLESIQTNAMALVKARSRLRDGINVFADIDSTAPAENRPAVETPVGTRYVAPGLITLAHELRVPIVFMAVRFDESGHLVLFFRHPSGEEIGQILKEFCEFFALHAAAVRR